MKPRLVLLIALAVAVCLSCGATPAPPAPGPVRQPVFACTPYPGDGFYPANKAQLSTIIDAYFAASRDTAVADPIVALIEPHAGYQYSGAQAARGYAQLRGRVYRTVILIGPSHRASFSGVAVYPDGAWESPLGRVEIDRDMAVELMRECPFVRSVPEAFAQEHSLEVQLPFLQKSLSGFRIVPLVTGNMDGAQFRELGGALAGIIESRPGEILVVVSTDMSHYHAAGIAEGMDALALADIDAMNLEKLADDLNRGRCEFCGDRGVVAWLLAARQLGAKPEHSSYTHSGNTSGDMRRVVGYGTVIFTLKPSAAESGELDKVEQEELLEIARATVESYVRTGRVPEFAVRSRRLQERRGAFVTLKEKGALRGCIGTFQPEEPLWKVVRRMAVAAATEDHRFRPVAESELEKLKYDISVLSPLRRITDWREIKLGVHGVQVVRGWHNGVFLPQVATETGWDLETFMGELCSQKAGLPRESWKDPATRLYVFTAQVFGD